MAVLNVTKEQERAPALSLTREITSIDPMDTRVKKHKTNNFILIHHTTENHCDIPHPKFAQTPEKFK